MFYKITTKPEDYPNGPCRIIPFEDGDSIFVPFKGIGYKLGDRYLECGMTPCYVSKIYYDKHYWWQFWKKKKIIGYNISSGRK